MSSSGSHLDRRSIDGFVLSNTADVPPIDPRISTPDKSTNLHDDGDHEKAPHHSSGGKRDSQTSYDDIDGVEPLYVEFEEGDVRNPMNASHARKWAITLTACAFTGLTAGAGSSIASGFPSMNRDLDSTNEQAAAALSLYCLGFGVVPLVTASLSEEFGRQPLYIVSSVVFMLMHLMTALSTNASTVLIARFISGAAGSTGATMVGGTIADIWEPSERGVPMSLFSLTAVGSTTLSPVFAGWIEQNAQLQWRWIQWIHLIAAAAYILIMLAVMSETRGGVILTREARRLRRETGNQRYRARVEDETSSMRQLIYVSCTRPIYLLFTEPVVASFSLWAGLAWGILYSQLESVSLIFTTLHHFSSGQVGLAFLPMFLGAFFGFVSNIYQERIYHRRVKRMGPEARLYSGMVAAVLFPIGCFIYAWTAIPGVHWIGPMVGLFIFIFALYIIYLAVFSYLADVYLIYASSALAGQSLCRNLMGVAFPLFTNQMYSNLTFHWASTLFGCLAVILAVVPFILFARGPQIRARSRFARKLERQQQGETTP